MNCPMQSHETAEILLDYCARALPADTLARMDVHVAMCCDCRQQLAAQKMIWSALDEFDASELNISSDFDRRLYARIEAEHRDPVWVRAWRSLFASGQPGAWRPAFSMMAVAGVAVLGLFLVRLPDAVSNESKSAVNAPVAISAEVETETPVKTAPLKTATVDKLDVEHLDRALEDLEMLQVLGGTGNGPGKSNAL